MSRRRKYQRRKPPKGWTPQPARIRELLRDRAWSVHGAAKFLGYGARSFRRYVSFNPREFRPIPYAIQKQIEQLPWRGLKRYTGPVPPERAVPESQP